MIPRQLGNYEVLEHLRTGGVGEVFIGLDRMLNRTVAIKALRKEVSHNKALATRFRAEAENLARLNHPNITTLYSLHQEGDTLYMIMELIRGVTLEDLLTSEQRLREDEALAIVAQVLEGLNYAHRASVVHRDIKPANLMLTNEGLVKIMDFGIARVHGSERMTQHGHMVGTATYMAPEQVRGHQGDERSDIYSLGAVLYELLSGHPPFESDNEYELLRSHIEQPIKPLIDCARGVSTRVSAAVSRALAKEPSKRFRSVQDFADSLGTDTLKVRGVDVIQERFSGVVGKRMPSIPDTASLKRRSLAPAKTRISAMPDARQVNSTRLSAESGSGQVDVDKSFRHRLGLSPIIAIAMAGILLVIMLGFVLWDLTSTPSPEFSSIPSRPATIKENDKSITKFSPSRSGKVTSDKQSVRPKSEAKRPEEAASAIATANNANSRTIVEPRSHISAASEVPSAATSDQRTSLNAYRPKPTDNKPRSNDTPITRRSDSQARKPSKKAQTGWKWQH